MTAAMPSADAGRAASATPPSKIDARSRAAALVSHCGAAARGLGGTLLDLLYPPRCALCPTDIAPGGVALCSGCRHAISQQTGPTCRRCGANVGPYHTGPTCYYCDRERFAFEGVWPLGRYDGNLRWACLRLKEPRAESLAAALTALLTERQAPALAQLRIDIIVPIPQFWAQAWFRPHNAAEWIAERLAHAMQLPWDRAILCKTRWSRRQAALAPTERRRNLRGAFRARRSCDGRRVLLVDDVMTTGSTLHEAARALRRAGAAHVFAAVIARGLGHLPASST